MKVHGFTLVELLVVIAVLGLLTSLAAPGMSSYLARRSVSAASSTLAADLRYARSEAVKRSGYVTVCRSTDGTSCAGAGGSWSGGWIVFTDSDGLGNGSVGGNDAVLRVQPKLVGVGSLQNATLASTRGHFAYQPIGIGIAQSDTLVVSPEVGSVVANRQLMCISSQGRALVRPMGATACS